MCVVYVDILAMVVLIIYVVKNVAAIIIPQANIYVGNVDAQVMMHMMCAICLNGVLYRDVILSIGIQQRNTNVRSKNVVNLDTMSKLTNRNIVL